MTRVLVTGAAGQIGSELVPALRGAYGAGNVLASDVRDPGGEAQEGPFRRVDCTDRAQVAAAVREHRPDAIYHLAALLSAASESRPQEAYRVNFGGLVNVLEVAREAGSSVFSPSSIAVFGPGTPDPAPQDAVQRPTTMYGVTKVAGELLCDYYHRRYGVDARGLRYPGIISHTAPPGGGSTDYAVEIFRAAVRDGHYVCPIRADTQVDMMYMPDAVRAAIELMEADGSRLRHRNAFNVTAMQVTPAALAAEIARHLPDFRIGYEVDPVPQGILDSWPRRIDDGEARAQWGWRAEYGLAETVRDMLAHLRP